MNAYTRNLIILWALVLAVYVSIFLFTSPIRMARFTPAEQHSLFDQISGLACEYGVLEGKEREIEAHTSLSAIIVSNHLASTDIRYLYWLALQQNWQTPECFTYVMSQATCDEHLAELGTASYTLELLYKHTRRQAQLFAEQGLPPATTCTPVQRTDELGGLSGEAVQGGWQARKFRQFTTVFQPS